MFDDFILRQLESILSLFIGASEDRLRHALDVIISSPVPDFTLDWFKALYSLVFGLAVVLAFPIALGQFSYGLLRHKYEYMRLAGLTFAYSLIGGMFLPLFFHLGMLLSDALTQAVMTIPGPEVEPTFFERFFGFGEGLVFNPIEKLLFAPIHWAMTWLLGITATAASLSAYLSLILGVISLPLINLGRLGEKLARWALAIAFVALFSRPLMAFVIAISVVVIGAFESMPLFEVFVPFFPFLKLLILAVTGTIPLVLFIAYQTKLARIVGGFINVRGHVESRSRDSMSYKMAFAAAGAVHFLHVNSDRLRQSWNDNVESSSERWKSAQGIATRAATRALTKGHPVLGIGAEVSTIAIERMRKRAEGRDSQPETTPGLSLPPPPPPRN